MWFRKKKEVKPQIFTEETCQACNENTRRRFEDGDFVYKAAAVCKNCFSSNTLITAIYGEYPAEPNKN